jgi:hypothetical protein
VKLRKWKCCCLLEGNQMSKGKSNRLGKIYVHESLYYDIELVSNIF